MKALLIKPFETPQVVEGDMDLDFFQKHVEGLIERIHEGSEFIIWGNDEAKLLGMEPNLVATLIAGVLGWPGFRYDLIAGPVLIVGLDPSNSETYRDVPQAIVDYAKQFRTEWMP